MHGPEPGDAAAAGAVLVLLAAGALALTRVILRPLRAAADLADIAAQATIAPAGGEQNNWPLGQTVATMTERDRRSAAEMSQRLVEACLELRRSISVVHGFAQYCRQRGRPAPSSADRMLRRVADEVARMEALVEGLRTRTATSWPVVRAGQRR